MISLRYWIASRILPETILAISSKPETSQPPVIHKNAHFRGDPRLNLESLAEPKPALTGGIIPKSGWHQSRKVGGTNLKKWVAPISKSGKKDLDFRPLGPTGCRNWNADQSLRIGQHWVANLCPSALQFALPNCLQVPLPFGNNSSCSIVGRHVLTRHQGDCGVGTTFRRLSIDALAGAMERSEGIRSCGFVPAGSDTR